MINKPTLEQVTTCLDVINWAIDDLDIKATDNVLALYKALVDKEREFKDIRSHLSAVIHMEKLIIALIGLAIASFVWMVMSPETYCKVAIYGSIKNVPGICMKYVNGN